MKNKATETSLRRDAGLWLLFALASLLVRGLTDWVEFGRVRWGHTLAGTFILASLVVLGARLGRWHRKRGESE